ncbi:ribose 5-phosphate isomerase A [Pontibacillus salicampi]|uniref:Ribose 5-phosphate isomerase A n=1 Tax=Pontibacillus salicampi TaxID=1449801 RepID=A0ABV6LQ63_9BACI
MSKWQNSLAATIQWSNDISNKDAKEEVAKKVAERVKDGDVIGVGSGSTSFLAVQAIAKKMKYHHLSVTAIPTSHEVEVVCAALNIPTTSLTSQKPDWAFDGADEVDEQRNLIKGRGGAMFHEKLVMASSPENYILVDPSKFVKVLGENFAVPMEVDARALHLVEHQLSDFPVEEVTLRQAESKDGPVITEAGNLIIDVRFATIEDDFETRLAAIPGIIETGLFMGYDVELLTVQ